MEPDPAAHAGFGAELRVDWIGPDLLGSAGGRLGLTGLPGKSGASVRYPGRTYARDLDTDLATLAAAGVGRLILLVEDSELQRWSRLDIVERARRHGVEVLRHPIPDGEAPSSTELMARVLDEVDQGRARTDVAVACMGGVGRSGTVAACALVRAGSTPDAAIMLVRSIRHPSAVETREQEAFVRAYAATLDRP